MTYEFRLGKRGYDVYNKTTGEKMNKKPLSSKSKARALIRTLTDKKNDNKRTREGSLAMRILGRELN
tara:strand:+ start:2199 stop:2399 length:201 start_codon:yes stop_codon:yes gene_type:complete